MNSILPIGIDTLLHGGVETARLELKASWDETTTGPQVLKTICAFANDLQNLNGGYLVLGIRQENGAMVRPVTGLTAAEIEAAQRWIRGNCNRLEPAYMPVFSVETVDGARVLVLWAPASDIRPHQAPDGARGDRRYWVRIGAETIVAKDDLLQRLIQQTARVPFDDRRAFDARNEDLRFAYVAEFLRDVGSGLIDEPDANRVYSAMMLTRPQNGHTSPRNVGLLFFSDDPTRWFRGARIEIAHFSDDAGGNTIAENVLRGPLHHQVRQCLSWLTNHSGLHIEKSNLDPRARTWVDYPAPALREALVNAIYHRGYEDSVEPTKVYVYPDRIEVISYPGPVDGIEPEHLTGDQPAPHVPARNRRIGELLKELRLAESRGTGLPKIRAAMRDNGSPPPRFQFDHTRTWFRATLPKHP